MVLCDLVPERVSNVLQYLFSQIVENVFPCPALALREIFTGVSDSVSHPGGEPVTYPKMSRVMRGPE